MAAWRREVFDRLPCSVLQPSCFAVPAPAPVPELVPELVPVELGLERLVVASCFAPPCAAFACFVVFALVVEAAFDIASSVAPSHSAPEEASAGHTFDSASGQSFGSVVALPSDSSAVASGPSVEASSVRPSGSVSATVSQGIARRG